MNTTKTLRLPPRRLMTSTGPRSRPNHRPNKRKEIVGLDEAHQVSFTAKSPKPPPTDSNLLLAGYLAHEFLTRGTLYGQPWDKPANGSASAAEPTEKREAEPELQKNYQSYVEVSNLFKHRGAHFEGIVNPTQLASLLNL